ncbi:DUF6053 domain-containing protein [Lysobacter enzymogenes]
MGGPSGPMLSAQVAAN